MTEHSIVGQNAAPTQRQTQKNRYALEPTRKKELEHHSDQGDGPDHEEDRRRIETLLGLQQKWCVSSRDEDVDGRMVKAPQKPLKSKLTRLVFQSDCRRRKSKEAFRREQAPSPRCVLQHQQAIRSDRMSG